MKLISVTSNGNRIARVVKWPGGLFLPQKRTWIYACRGAVDTKVQHALSEAEKRRTQACGTMVGRGASMSMTPICNSSKYETDQGAEVVPIGIAEQLETELKELQSLFELQHKRTIEADRLWQIAHNQPHVWPDLGKLVEWLMEKAFQVRCCRNCKNWTGGIQPACGGCAYMLKDPAAGKDMWEKRP